jgi:beta-mannanase
MLGVYQHGAPWEMGPLAAFEARAERPVAIVMWYQDWAGSRELDLRMFERVAEHGAVPLLTWEPWDHTGGIRQPAFALQSILAGDHDRYVRTAAERLAGFGGPVLLRWGHEMNGHWYPWGAGAGATASQYVAAWRRLWHLFHDAGASNVAWVWSPNILDRCADFAPWYPGAEYVDWLALDGYNWGGWGRWRSFRRLFATSYARLAVLGPQPIMIAETASAEAGGDKARWITEALTEVVPNELPRVRAVIWFNQHKERDWRIESSARSQHAFAAAVASPWYHAIEPRLR